MPGWHLQPWESPAGGHQYSPRGRRCHSNVVSWLMRLMLPNTAAAAQASTLVHPRFTSFPLYFSPEFRKTWVSSSFFSPPPSPWYIQVNLNKQEQLKYISYPFSYIAIKPPGIQPDKQTQEVHPNMLVFFTGGLHSFHNNSWGEEKIYS